MNTLIEYESRWPNRHTRPHIEHKTKKNLRIETHQWHSRLRCRLSILINPATKKHGELFNRFASRSNYQIDTPSSFNRKETLIDNSVGTISASPYHFNIATRSKIRKFQQSEQKAPSPKEKEVTLNYRCSTRRNTELIDQINWLCHHND